MEIFQGALTERDAGTHSVIVSALRYVCGMSCQPKERNGVWPPPTAHSPLEWQRIFNLTGLPPRYQEFIDPLVHKIAREFRAERGEPEPWAALETGHVETDLSHSGEPQAVGIFAKHLADVIRWQRYRARRKMRSVAAGAALTVSTRSRIERGQRAMTVDELARIAGALDLPITMLVELAVAQARDRLPSTCG